MDNPTRKSRTACRLCQPSGEMTSLGIVPTSRPGDQFGLIEFGDRTQHFTAMAEQDTEPVEVLVRQFGKNTKINPVLGKTQRVLSKPKLPEPI